MAAVLPPSHSTGILMRGEPIKRNNPRQRLYIDISQTQKPSETTYEPQIYSSSLSSSAPSSPRYASYDLSNLSSVASTPASSVSLQDNLFADQDADLQFPSYDATPDDDSPTPNNYSPASPTDSLDDCCPEHKIFRSVGDDLDVKDLPTRHVDYLSHSWREEDVWSSWRHIVGKRGELENWERLENAAWRTWQKSRNNLPVVPAERLNWMKEHDVTWLYGPLQTGNMKKFGEAKPAPALSRVDSLMIAKKSCLKKRSLSEAMLQRSISTSTLVQQAVDSLKAQNLGKGVIRPSIRSRNHSKYGSTTRLPAITPNDTPTALASFSTTSSGVQSPARQRHISFNNSVGQCIAINQEIEVEPLIYQSSESESEDELLMMIPEKGKFGSGQSTPRGSFSSEGGARTIAILAPTTLRADTPEPKAPVRLPTLTRTTSQETLKPTRPGSNYLWDDADDGELSWSPSPAFTDNDFADEDEEMQLKGLRRTPSGMFMPYDDDANEYTSTGVLGRVIDTINTAKDIAHVVWNVGWRK